VAEDLHVQVLVMPPHLAAFRNVHVSLMNLYLSPAVVVDVWPPVFWLGVIFVGRGVGGSPPTVGCVVMQLGIILWLGYWVARKIGPSITTWIALPR